MTTTITATADGLSGELGVNGNPKMRFGADTSGQPFSFRNLLVNSTFQVNNGNAGTPYVTAAALATGTYGHEMWKAGASGGDYSFTQNLAITQITIASGKSLIQVIEDKFVEGGSYVLSWTGTAQARVTINSATPSGSFASSPILVTGQTAGTTMSVEFNAGTLSKAQLEVGSIATKFEFRQDELQRTQRYFEVGAGVDYLTYQAGGSGFRQYVALKTTMRAIPAIAFSSTSYVNASGISAFDVQAGGFNASASATALGACGLLTGYTANARL